MHCTDCLKKKCNKDTCECECSWITEPAFEQDDNVVDVSDLDTEADNLV